MMREFLLDGIHVVAYGHNSGLLSPGQDPFPLHTQADRLHLMENCQIFFLFDERIFGFVLSFS